MRWLLTSMPRREITVSWEESFYNIKLVFVTLVPRQELTALSSAKFPHLEKWALRLAFELPPATPHRARKTPAVLRIVTRMTPAGTIGERQSRIMAISLNTSAASRYVLHSGSRAVPTRCANKMVATRPDESCRMCRRRADVGDALALPTPTPGDSQYDG